jgi:hypothetical protein
VTLRHRAIVAWGLGGILLLLLQAIARLAPRAVEAMASRLGFGQWTVLVLWVVFSAYAEAYRGFHLRFSPRVVARAHHLAADPWPLAVLLAPAYCMSLFHSTRRQRAVSWGLLVAIGVLVVLVARVPQPWRGIVDAGVVVGLAGGAVSILVHGWRAETRGPATPSDLPPATA